MSYPSYTHTYAAVLATDHENMIEVTRFSRQAGASQPYDAWRLNTSSANNHLTLFTFYCLLSPSLWLFFFGTALSYALWYIDSTTQERRQCKSGARGWRVSMVRLDSEAHTLRTQLMQVSCRLEDETARASEWSEYTLFFGRVPLKWKKKPAELDSCSTLAIASKALR